MLIARIYINHRQIEEIRIQNITGRSKMDGKIHQYKIRQPKGVDKIIKHIRSDGYEPLLIKVLRIIEKSKNE